MRRLDEVRERRASRLRTRAARGDGSVQMSTLVDDDDAVAVLSRVEALAKATQDAMDEMNAKVAAETGRSSTMRAHVFVDDLLDILNGSDLPDTLIPGKGSGIRESSTPT